jgi:hypothetical protein
MWWIAMIRLTNCCSIPSNLGFDTDMASGGEELFNRCVINATNCCAYVTVPVGARGLEMMARV